jgi:hypothetical protein
LVEDVAKHVLKRYHFGNGGGTEHYNSNATHTADVFDFSCCVCDTLASSFEFITREALLDKLLDNLEGERNSSSMLHQVASTNKLHEFLEMDEDERGCQITRVEGHVTWLPEFKEAFVAKMKTPYVADPAVFNLFGFKSSDKRENMCTACKQLSKIGCCPLYSSANRCKKVVIHNMMLSQNESV